MRKSNSKKIILLLFFLLIIFSFYSFGIQNYFTLSYVQNHLIKYQQTMNEAPTKTICIFAGVYILATALSFPGATLLTLLAGALFGVVQGTVIVSIASTLGATIAFLMTRYIFADFVRKLMGSKMKVIDDGIEKDGNWYLVSMRLMPLFPFFVVNLAMGLTAISTRSFYIYSQLGMIPGTFVFVLAGRELSKIKDLSSAMSLPLISAFFLVGLFPALIKKIIEHIHKK